MATLNVIRRWALRDQMSNRIDVLFLLSGDGDYLPVVEEASRQGKQVWLAAFSKGLSKRLRFAVDEFIDLDEIFFTKPRKPRASSNAQA